MNACIFCQIIEGQTEHYPVFENDGALAFLNLFPNAKGHTLVVPKRHVKTLLELTEEEMASWMAATKATMLRLEETLGADGFSVGVNHGKAAGQSVMHLHMHIMPRWNGDEGGNMHTIINKPSDQSVEEIAKIVCPV